MMGSTAETVPPPLADAMSGTETTHLLRDVRYCHTLWYHSRLRCPVLTHAVPNALHAKHAAATTSMLCDVQDSTLVASTRMRVHV
eukprot:2882943-Rhodomonas_salina.1